MGVVQRDEHLALNMAEPGLVEECFGLARAGDEPLGRRAHLRNENDSQEHCSQHSIAYQTLSHRSLLQD